MNAVMVDMTLLVMYGLTVIISKPDRRTTAIAVFVWFMTSFIVAEQGWTALPTFTCYWVMAGALSVLLALRGSLLVLWASGSMFLLQMAMVADSLMTKEITPLYGSYGVLSLILNLFILLTTYIHGQGLESVNNNDNPHNSIGRGNK